MPTVNYYCSDLDQDLLFNLQLFLTVTARIQYFDIPIVYVYASANSLLIYFYNIIRMQSSGVLYYYILSRFNKSSVYKAFVLYFHALFSPAL